MDNRLCFLGLALFAGLLVSSSLESQTKPKDGECKADEIDMGDYCASLPPATTESEKKRRRVTRFRGESMMPGRKASMPAKPKASIPPLAETPVPVPPAPESVSGFIVQLGAFSTRDIAESVARSIGPQSVPISVVPLDRGDYVLWACIQGPFESREAAVESRNQLRKDERFSSAYVKFMEAEIKQGLVHDDIEE